MSAPISGVLEHHRHRNDVHGLNPDIFDHGVLFARASAVMSKAIAGPPARGKAMNAGEIGRLRAAWRCAEDCQANGFHRIAAEVLLHYFGGLI